MKFTRKRNLVIFVTLSILLTLFAFQQSVQSRTKIYYSGEAVSYKNNLVFATVNTGALELFTLDNDQIHRTLKIKPQFVSLPKGSDNYHDVEFIEMNGRLYLFTTNGRYLYKFDVSNPYKPQMLEKIKDNSWDWFLALEKTDDFLVTIGTNNIKFWDDNLQVIQTYDLDVSKPENIIVSEDGSYIFSIVNNILAIYDTDKREVVKNIWLTSKEESLRGVYYDDSREEIYVTDDTALKVFDINAKELRRFNHTSDYGYDVVASTLGSSVYFSDGIGIVRNDKLSMKAIDWKYTTNIAGGNGWTMDIDVVRDLSGDKLVAFNNHEILVLDNDLELVDSFRATDKDEAPIEGLSIKLDKSEGFSGDYLTVSGGGYGMNEQIIIHMGNQKWETSADSNGRYKRTIEVINVRSQSVDIKVDGQNTGLTYSTSFKVN